MRAVLLSARARAGTGEVLSAVRAIVSRHATVVGEFDVNDAIPAALQPDRAVAVGDAAVRALHQFGVALGAAPVLLYAHAGFAQGGGRSGGRGMGVFGHKGAWRKMACPIGTRGPAALRPRPRRA
jgi:hypothetical protein